MNEKTKYERLAEYMASKPHGNRGRYVAGCRCFECRLANSEYYHEVRRNGPNPLVAVDEAVEHCRRLSKRGIGYKTVADYAEVSRSHLFKMITGKQMFVRKRTAERILAVDENCLSGRTLVSARKTWQRIEWLKSEGFSKAEIARRIGNKAPALQIRKDKVQARTAMRIEKLYNLMRLGE